MNLFEHVKLHYKPDLWLLFVCILWGMSFPTVKIALNHITPMLFLALRFWIGVLLLLPVCILMKVRWSLSYFKKGFFIGIFMFLGMFFQTIGLKYTTASNSGFITGMSVIFVPLLVIFIEKRIPNSASITGVILATGGIFFLTQPQVHGLNRGDLFTLLCAISFAFEILLIEILVKDGEALGIAFIISLVTAFLSSISIPVFNGFSLTWNLELLIALAYVSIFCTAMGFTLQTYWQPKTTATAAAVIYASEPVFAALFSMRLLRETMNLSGWMGGGLILCGMMISELRK